ncbi:MAG: hypothetical protein JNL79_26195 [Myxococcales bacterium]|nr:hypothetical protein [Myxococcales bacterium]
MPDDIMKDDDNDVTDPQRLIARLNHFADQMDKIKARLNKLAGKSQGPLQDPAPLARLVGLGNDIAQVAGAWQQRP